jgi:hypothetical protein
LPFSGNVTSSPWTLSAVALTDSLPACERQPLVVFAGRFARADDLPFRETSLQQLPLGTPNFDPGALTLNKNDNLIALFDFLLQQSSVYSH